MTKYFIIPGLGNSGPDHWQTHFEKSLANCTRIQQVEWDEPDCINWINTINKQLENEKLTEVVLIAHSLGCATVAHWANNFQQKIKGALLVAPSDLEAPAYTFNATGFSPFPLQTLPFKSIVVARTNDPWVSLARATQFANAWGSELMNIGDAEHINAAAGFGVWPAGLAILKQLDGR
jgi:uncharacterized protein